MASISPYFSQLLSGLYVTLQVAVASFFVGLLIAVVAVPLRVSGPRAVKAFLATYVTIVRGLPELMIIFLVFYGGTVLLSRIAGTYVEVNALSAGIAALAAVAAAYLIEILRAALLSIPIGQWEAAKSLGLRRGRTFVSIVLPQMLHRALPALGNQWLITLKDSALVSIVGLEELMRKSVIAAGATHNPLAFYLIAAAIYILVTSVSSLLLGVGERRLSAHMR